MAMSQKTFCSFPSFAAQPTQIVPTTNTTCVRTRSKRPSSFFRTPLRCSTSRSRAATLEFSIGELKYSELLLPAAPAPGLGSVIVNYSPTLARAFEDESESSVWFIFGSFQRPATEHTGGVGAQQSDFEI